MEVQEPKNLVFPYVRHFIEKIENLVRPLNIKEIVKPSTTIQQQVMKIKKASQRRKTSKEQSIATPVNVEPNILVKLDAHSDRTPMRSED